ncbi:MAG: hypothetical protein QNJ74_00955 [Trichodesmium sp. MO_231.B1]|nr:hypothetical protein [Trichodesmium sp. MO_231.B1]
MIWEFLCLYPTLKDSISVLGDLLAAIDCKLNFVYLLRKGWDIDMYTRKAMLGNGCVFLPTLYFPVP